MGVIVDTRVSEALRIFGALPQTTPFSCVPACVATAVQIEWDLNAPIVQAHLIRCLRTETKGTLFESAAKVITGMVGDVAVPLFGSLDDLLERMFEGTVTIGIDSSLLYQNVAEGGGHAVLVASAMKVSDYPNFPKELLPQKVRGEGTWIADPARSSGAYVKTEQLEKAFEAARKRFPIVANGLLIRSRP